MEEDCAWGTGHTSLRLPQQQQHKDTAAGSLDLAHLLEYGGRNDRLTFNKAFGGRRMAEQQLVVGMACAVSCGCVPRKVLDVGRPHVTAAGGSNPLDPYPMSRFPSSCPLSVDFRREAGTQVSAVSPCRRQHNLNSTSSSRRRPRSPSGSSPVHQAVVMRAQGPRRWQHLQLHWQAGV
jgi:hypothetical protein